MAQGRAEQSKEERLAEEAAWMQVASQFLTDKVIPRFELVQSEVVVGVNWETGEAQHFHHVKDRDYPDMPGWMFGTMDLVCRAFGTTEEPSHELWVADWKTGGTDGAEEQLLSLLAATKKALESMGQEPITKASICCLKVTDEGVWPKEREVSAEELDQHWLAMRLQWEQSQKECSPKPGIHCTAFYCKHLAYCPAIRDVVLQAAEQDGIIPIEVLLKKKLNDQPLDNEEASGTIELVTAAKRQITYLTECMKEWVRNNGPIVSGTWTWGPGKDGFRWRKRK